MLLPRGRIVVCSLASICRWFIGVTTHLVKCNHLITSYVAMCSKMKLVSMLSVCICCCTLQLLPLASAFGPSSTEGRRAFLQTASSAVAPIVGSALCQSRPASAATPQLPFGLIEARVTENVLSPPPYGREDADIIYPDWFRGTWNVYSECTSVEAPCGIPLFGGNSTFAKAKQEIGPANALRYRARFVEGSAGTIADRDYNVREIVKQAMGENAVQDVSLATPDKFSCLLAPAGAGQILTVDLLTLARRQENIDAKNFHCAEVVRQVVAPINQNKPQMTPLPSQQPSSKTVLLKEIETASLYTLEDDDKVRCLQRSATFLLPSQQDPLAQQLWQMSRGRPIDVRFYDVTYTRR